MARRTRDRGEGDLTLRDRQRAQTRLLFIEAAAACFKENGYAATSVDDIARAAGANRATFYLHFASKAAIITSLLDTVEKETVDIHERLAEAVAAGTREALREWLDLAFQFWERLTSLLAAEQEAAALHPEVGTARDRVFERGVQAMVAGLEQAGRGNDRTRRVRGVLAYSQLQSVSRRWVRVGWDVDRTEMLELMTDMWVTVFDAKETGPKEA